MLGIPLFFLVIVMTMITPTISKVVYNSQKLSRLLEEDEAGDTRFEFNVQTHNMYYKRISENLQSMENAYTECLDHLSNNNYTEDSVNSCVGKDMIYVINDIDYERKQIIGRADSKIRSYLNQFCYVPADGLAGLNSCDLLERDLLELLWNELNFGVLLDYHRSKYTDEAAQVPEADFDKIVAYLQNLYTEFAELLEEIDDHSIITRANIKKSIDMRTRVIIEQAHENVRNPKPKIIKHTIEIEEKINNPNTFDVDHIPRPTTNDGSTTIFGVDTNPAAESLRSIVGDVNDNDDLDGPTVTIHERRLSKENNSEAD